MDAMECTIVLDGLLLFLWQDVQREEREAECDGGGDNGQHDDDEWCRKQHQKQIMDSRNWADRVGYSWSLHILCDMFCNIVFSDNLVSFWMALLFQTLVSLTTI